MNETGGADMSEELKRKLFDYEENPPARMWDRISASLDEEINAEFPQKIYDAAVVPPSGTWEKIATALDEDVADLYPIKLYNLEVQPPVAAWSGIVSALDEEAALPQISRKGKVIPFVRYAVAVCVLGLVAFFAVRLISQKSANNSTAGTEKTNPAQDNSTANVQQKKDSSTDIEQPSNNLPKESPALARVETRSKTRSLPQSLEYMTDVSNVSHNYGGSSETDFQQMSLRGDIPATRSLVSLDDDRYLMFMNPDGYFIRMSKKLAEAFGCLYTNGNSEEYRQCQEQVKKWREKLAQSQINPSTDNFMDIINLIKSADNKEL